MKIRSRQKSIDASGKLIALIVITIILVVVPLTYFLTIGKEDTNGKEEPTEGLEVSIEGSSGKKNLKLEDLEGLTASEGVTSYQNRFGNWRGHGTYKGVPLSELANQAGGMAPGDVMTVTASDGYVQNFTYYQVYPTGNTLALQGKIILAYQFNGTKVPAWEDGPMLAVLPADGQFSNDDLNQTVARDPEFASSNSGGSLWVRNVANIRITSLYDEWTLHLISLANETTELTRTDFVRYKFAASGEYTDPDGGLWTGVPLSVLLGIVDDADPTTLNASLVETDYRVESVAKDGYSKTVAVKSLIQNNVIVADIINGSLVTGKHTPIRLVGNGLTSGQMIGALVSIRILPPEQPAEIVLTLVGETTKEFTMDQLKALEVITGSGGFVKSTGAAVGPFTYKGVKVSELLAEVLPGSDMNYSLEVEATDGYTMTYTPSQVNGMFAVYDEQGNTSLSEDLILLMAYEEVGQAEFEGGPLRIVIVGEGTEAPMTDGHFWSKYARYLRIKGFVGDWTVNLTGLTSMKMDRATFESLASCEYHQITVEDGEDTYEGIPLWVMVSAVDGADQAEGHYMFNAELADAGYNITVIASDGFNTTFHSSQVARNNSIIIAHKMNGEPLSNDTGPLRIVGEGLTGKQKVSNVVEIRLEDLPELSLWNLTLSGKRTIIMDSTMFAAQFDCGAHNAYYNYTKDSTEYHYAGIPLWIFVGAVDDLDSGHYTLNEALALTGEGYTIRVIAGDGYNYTFHSSQVANNDSIILAFQLDGAPLEGDDYPLKIVGEGLTGKQKVSNVVEIRLEFPPVPLWNLTLAGVRTVVINSLEFEALVADHGVQYNDTSSGDEYLGVPLWVLVAVIDGNADDNYTLNQTLVTQGYNVTVYASDGYNKSFPIAQIADNNSIILAFQENGAVLEGDDAPLKIVGEGLSSSMKIKAVVKIECMELIEA